MSNTKPSINTINISLIYNEWLEDDAYKSFSLDSKNLKPKEIQQAIYEYIINQNDIKLENKRLKNLLDELMIERDALKHMKDFYMDKYDSGD